MRKGDKNIEKIFQLSRHQFLLMEKLEKPFLFMKNWSFKEIGFESLIMHREGWKLNLTAPLIHLFYNNYHRAYYTN